MLSNPPQNVASEVIIAILTSLMTNAVVLQQTACLEDTLEDTLQS